jgi:DNA-binding CsgD family transcriptional regulator
MTTKGRPQSIDTAQVQACQAQGMTQQQTADRLGLSLSGVRAHWTRITTNGRPAGRTEKARNIAALLAEGLTDRQIAERLGVAVSTVNRKRRQA